MVGAGSGWCSHGAKCSKLDLVRIVRRNWWRWVTWIAGSLVTALVLARPGTSVTGKYALTWYAVAFMLLAVVARKHQLVASAVTILGIAAGLFFSLGAAVAVVSNQDPSAWLYIVGGIAAAGLSTYQLVRRRLDPVALVAIQLGIGLVAYWAYNAVSGLGLNPSSYPPETLVTPFRVEVPLIALALAGVGFGIARDGHAARRRLALTMPAWWHFFLALLVAYALIGLDGFANYLTYWIVPGEYQAVCAVLEKIDTGPVLVGLVYAGLAGIGEEVLFRGALQPRAGLVATALLFAMIHIQFGVTPILAWVFIAGLAFGALRIYFNTTTAILAHALTGFLALLEPSLLTKVGFWIAFLVVAVPFWRWLRSREGTIEEPTALDSESIG